MPTHKVKGGYKWGKHGKVYPTKKQADKQGQAIYANGWKETNKNKMIKNMAKIKLTENDLRQIVLKSVKKTLNEMSENFQEVPNEWYEMDEKFSADHPEMDFWEYVEELGEEETLEIILNNTPKELISKWNEILFNKCHEYYQTPINK